jgi:radical SAM enzyme (TIGR01210 family)
MLPVLSAYPKAANERDAWIIARRGPRNAVDPRIPYAFLVEDERTAAGEIVPTATLFLTNRECPWHCLMCDLWRNTLTDSVTAGAIPEQIDHALARLPEARQIKLYNSGSFFDPRAIPVEDYAAIAQRLEGFDRVIVECHPALLNDTCLRFSEMIRGTLEIAMGLETVHPEILPKLNKRMTLEMFERSARFLRQNSIDLRAFILVKPPFMKEDEAVMWAVRSLEFAFDCGATAAALIPTRGGNGAMEELASSGDFAPPTLRTLELATEHGVAMNRGRVFADVWDAESLPSCEHCRAQRIAQLRMMSLEQAIQNPVQCAQCEAEG